MFSMKKTGFLLFFLFGLIVDSVAQTNVVIAAAKDNTIFSNLPNNSNGAGDNFFSGAIASGPARRALLMFDLSLIPPGSTVTAVGLSLEMNRTISGAANMSLHRLNNTWGEGSSNAGSAGDGNGVPATAGDATWDCSFANGAGGCTTAWTTSGGDFQAAPSATTSVSGLGQYLWSAAQMIADVQSWVNTPGNNHGWILIGDEATPASAKRFSARTNPIPAQRPALSITYTGIVPVKLLYFIAQASKYGCLLQWETAQEINSDFFEIEQSSDGVNFNAIGRIAAAGQSNQNRKYSFTQPITVEGKYFYRLVSTDIGGHKEYSKIETVTWKTNNDYLLIAPNPVIDKLVLPGFKIDGSQRYIIINMYGQQIAGAALLKPAIQLPANLKPGIYQLRISSLFGTMQSASFMKR